MLKYLLIVAALAPAIMALTPVRQCPGGPPLPPTVDFNGCTSLPCSIVDGQALQAHALGIVSPVATNGLEAYIVIRLAGLQIPFPMPDGLEDACAIGTAPGTCPVSVGQVFDYHLDFEGQALGMTGITVLIEVGLRADDGSLVVCVEFDALITS